MEKIGIELTFKKKEVKAILRLLVKIAECDVEGVNRGALELAIQEVEGVLDRMKKGGRSVSTVSFEMSRQDLEQMMSIFDELSSESEDDPEDDPVDITKDIHEILAGGDGDEKSPEPAPKPKEEISSKKPPEILEAPVYKPEPAKVSVKKEVAKESVGFNYIPGTELEIRPSRFLRYLK